MHNGPVMKNSILVGWVLITEFAAAAFSIDLHASEQELFKVTSDMRDTPIDVRLKTDDATQEVVGMLVDDDFYSAKEIMAGTKIRVKGVDSTQDVLRLKAPGADLKSGGKLVMTYLRDGSLGEKDPKRYAELELNLKNIAPGAWAVYSGNSGRPVSVLHMVKNTFAFILIGIDKILVSFSNDPVYAAK